MYGLCKVNISRDPIRPPHRFSKLLVHPFVFHASIQSVYKSSFTHNRTVRGRIASGTPKRAMITTTLSPSPLTLYLPTESYISLYTPYTPLEANIPIFPYNLRSPSILLYIPLYYIALNPKA